MERDVILDPVSKRFVCTAAQPYVGAALRREYPRACHPDAVTVADFGETERLRCDHCGLTWCEELPQ